eukprot:9492216-Pyramimonas_sp.AAC.2
MDPSVCNSLRTDLTSGGCSGYISPSGGCALNCRYPSVGKASAKSRALRYPVSLSNIPANSGHSLSLLRKVGAAYPGDLSRPEYWKARQGTSTHLVGELKAGPPMYILSPSAIGTRYGYILSPSAIGTGYGYILFP